jgi:hypothetical protein
MLAWQKAKFADALQEIKELSTIQESHNYEAKIN